MAIEEVGSKREYGSVIPRLQTVQEFSIEIPDKEADQIHSGKIAT